MVHGTNLSVTFWREKTERSDPGACTGKREWRGERDRRKSKTEGAKKRTSENEKP